MALHKVSSPGGAAREAEAGGARAECYRNVRRMFPESRRMFPESRRMFPDSHRMFFEPQRQEWAAAAVVLRARLKQAKRALNVT